MEHCAGILIWTDVLYMEQSSFESGKGSSVRKIYFMVSPGGPLWDGKTLWAPPKGQIEPTDADEWSAAKREFKEEVGIDINDSAREHACKVLVHQRKDKNVTLFIVSHGWLTKDIYSSNDFTCTSTFKHTDGNDYPEIGKYRWVTSDEMESSGVRAYAELCKVLDTIPARKLAELKELAISDI